MKTDSAARERNRRASIELLRSLGIDPNDVADVHGTGALQVDGKWVTLQLARRDALAGEVITKGLDVVTTTKRIRLTDEQITVYTAALTARPAITEFLTERWDAEEAVAQEHLARVAGSPRRNGKTDARRRVADIAAKRAIVELHTCRCPNPDCRDCGACSGEHHADPTPAPCDTVKALAQPYAEHPDFDPAWRAG